MTKLKPVTTLAACVCLTACLQNGDVVAVNLDYAKTNYGYINSGDFKAGSFFLWDQGEARMVHLSDIPGFTPPPNPRDKTVQVAQYSSGAQIGGEAQKAAIKVRADALIAKHSAFEIAYPNSVTYDNTVTRITSYLGEDIRSGGSLMQEWGFADAVNAPDQYYVLVRKVTYGDGIKLLVDGEAEVGGGFNVIIKGADVNVRLQGKGLNAISGTDTEIAIDVYVFRPEWKTVDGGQNPNFKVQHFVKADDLPALFRSTSRRD